MIKNALIKNTSFNRQVISVQTCAQFCTIGINKKILKKCEFLDEVFLSDNPITCEVRCKQ